jgi:hypothetical protein
LRKITRFVSLKEQFHNTYKNFLIQQKNLNVE